MLQAVTMGACRRTGERMEAVAPPAAGSLGSRRKFRRDWSLLCSAVRLMPAVEGLPRRIRHLAMRPPGVEPVVDDEARKISQCNVGRGNRRSISRRPRQQFAGCFHGGFYNERNLVQFYEFPPPRQDLLMGVDLHRAN